MNFNKQIENFVSQMCWKTEYQIRNLKKENKQIVKKTNDTYIALGEIPDFQAKLINKSIFFLKVMCYQHFSQLFVFKYQAQEVYCLCNFLFLLFLLFYIRIISTKKSYHRTSHLALFLITSFRLFHFLGSDWCSFSLRRRNFRLWTTDRNSVVCGNDLGF